MNKQRMNIRTNLRSLRRLSTYIVSCSIVGAKTSRPYISAVVLGQSSLYHSCEVLEREWSKLLDPEFEQIYLVEQDPARGITNAKAAVQEAVRRFEERDIIEE